MMTDWRAFARAYGAQIAQMARGMVRRYRLPPAVSWEDLRQELTLHAWLAWERWTPGRGGMTRQSYTLCSARLDALRWINVQRNAYQRSCRAPSRFDLSEASVSPSDVSVPATLIERSSIEAGQEAAVAFGEAVRDALLAARCEDEKRAIDELVRLGFDDEKPGAMVAARRVYQAWKAARA